MSNLRWLKLLVRAAIGAWVVYCVVLLVLQRKLIFPRHLIEPSTIDLTRIANRVSLDVAHADGRSEGWLIPGVGRSPSSPGPVVIYTHGNGELIDHAAFGLEAYRRAGYSLALLEYRGYGRSDGEPSEVALIEDAVAFFDLVAARPEVDPTAIVLHGRSLGGGVACGVAAQRPPRALVLSSTFTRISDLAWRVGVPGFIVRDRFDNLQRLAHVTAPVLVTHGRRDQIIPFSHGEALAQRANVPLIAQDCGHNDCESSAYWGQVLDFLEGALAPTAKSR